MLGRAGIDAGIDFIILAVAQSILNLEKKVDNVFQAKKFRLIPSNVIEFKNCPGTLARQT